MVICLERDANLHMAHLMPLPLSVSCFSKIQIGFTFLVPAHLGSPGQRAVKRVCDSDFSGARCSSCHPAVTVKAGNWEHVTPPVKIAHWCQASVVVLSTGS